MPADEGEKIMHISLPVGSESMLMSSDQPAAIGDLTRGNNYNVSLHTDSDEEPDRLFNGFSSGG